MKIANAVTLLLVLVAVWLFLSGCEATPVVTPQPNVAAVRESNKQTQTHIKHTREHIDKVSEADAKVDDSLKAAAQDLDQLLKQ